MQAYRRTNKVAVTISALTIILPAIILPFRLAAPRLFPTCYSILIINRPCPMCGLTRGMGSIAWGRFSEALNYNKLSFVFFAVFLAEIVFRSYVLFAKPDGEKIGVIKAYDVKVHIALGFLYLLYAAWFHIG